MNRARVWGKSSSSWAATGEPVSSRCARSSCCDERGVLVVERVERELVGPHRVDVHERGHEVEHVGRAARHAGAEVAAGPAEHQDGAAGHVLAAVVAHALDDERRARVAHAEPLADQAAQEDLPGRRAVADDVARDHVVLGGEHRVAVGADRDAPARQALADVVVGVAEQPQRDAARQERAERLARRAR